MATVILRIRRQERLQAVPHWEEFEVERYPGMNIISCLMQIQKKPVTRSGETTLPVAWDCNCLEEVCGACSMIINGKPGQACSSLVDDLQQPIVLEPLTKFPIRRDLMVDRRKMFDNLKKIRGWIEIDGTYNLGIGPKRAGEEQQTAYKLSLCMTCGCCVEACPQVNSGSPFIGPAVISQVRYFNLHPTGKMNAHERLEALMEEDGIAGCGNAQNCVRVCPKCIPLTDSIADVQRQLTIYAIKRLFVK